MDFTSPLNEVLQLTFVFQESFALNYLLAALLFGFVLSFAVVAAGKSVLFAWCFLSTARPGGGWHRQSRGRFLARLRHGDSGSRQVLSCFKLGKYPLLVSLSELVVRTLPLT